MDDENINALLEEASAAGVRIVADGEDLLLVAASEPSVELQAAIAQNAAAVLRKLRGKLASRSQ